MKSWKLEVIEDSVQTEKYDVCLADVDIACGERRNARTHLEYAIREGGTLYVVEDARRMLAELKQKERMAGTDYGEGTAKI